MSIRKTSNQQTYLPREPRVPMRYPPKPEDFTLKRLESGAFGPHGIYGENARIPRSELLDLLRNSVKPGRVNRIEEVLLGRTTRVTMLLENLTDPANASACIRTCEALGLNEMHLIESYEPFRSSMGVTMNADKWIEVRKYSHYMNAVDRLKEDGYTLVATCLDDDAVPIDEIDFQSMDKVCVMLGSEQRGLSRSIRLQADVKVVIPMVGFSQSLNISTTCGIFLHALRSQGLCAPDLSDEELARLYKKWLMVSAKNAATILEKHGFADEVGDYC